MEDIHGNEHDESNGQFTSNGSTAAENKRADELTGTVQSSSEKIASVHIEIGKDNVLPKLNDEDIKKIDVLENKQVLIKASVIERNRERHKDVDPNDIDKIIGETLYSPAEIFKGNAEKPYYTFVKPMRLSPKRTGVVDNGLVLIDVDNAKENFEVVHWHWINEMKLNEMKEKLK